MNWKKVMSGVLAGTLVLTPVATTQAAREETPVLEHADGEKKDEPVSQETIAVEEEKVQEKSLTSLEEAENGEAQNQKAQVPQEGMVASYDFEKETLENGQNPQDLASAVVTGLGNYEGELTYEEDANRGKVLKLGKHGLKLNKANLGKEYTVSVWLKATQEQSDNQSVLFLGHHAPEKWVAVAGRGGTSWALWGNDGNKFSWTEFRRLDVSTNDWHCLTLTGKDGSVASYLDGKLLGEYKSLNPLEGENQDIYIGVNNWDRAFAGLVDDIKVYDRALRAGEVYRLFDQETSGEEILNAEGIEVTESIKMVMGRTKSIKVKVPDVVQEEGYEVGYESSDPSIARVDDQGNVTAVETGTASITTSVTVGATTITGTTQVSVSESVNQNLVASYAFEGNLDGAENSPQAQAMTTGLKNYDRSPVYETGHTGQAVRLGDYGLKLNTGKLGEEYTVTAWLKPDGTLTANQILLSLGVGNDSVQNWLALSGNANGSNECKIWGKGGVFDSWITLFTPTINSDRWHSITLTGTKGEVTVYLDGVKLGSAASNDPMNMEGADVYLGVNFWDMEFTGLVDDVQVYDVALTESEVQNQSKEEFNGILSEKLAQKVTEDSLLGDNDSAQNIRYDLNLPKTMDGVTIDWSSDSPCISADGIVTGPEENTNVTLTATAKAGDLKVSKNYSFTVAAYDRSELDEKMEEAKSLDLTYVTEEAKTRLESAMEEGAAANSYTKMEKAMARLNQAIRKLSYLPEYVNPFDSISDPVTEKKMQPGETAKLMEIPENIKDMVRVEYLSSDEETAEYQEGSVQAHKEGKVTVTAVVTAKYNDWTMEYSTALDVEESGVTPPNPGEPSTPSTGGDVVVTPPAVEQPNGNLEITVPSVTPGTAEKEADVTVKLPEQSLVQKVEKEQTVHATVKVPAEVAQGEFINLREITLSKEVLEAVKDSENELAVTVDDGVNAPYTWIIRGGDVDAARLSDVNLLLHRKDAKSDSQIKDKIYADEKGMVVDFEQKQGLPGTFAIRVDGEDYGLQPGDKVKFREYNEEKEVLQTAGKSCTVAEDGTITFFVSTGMKYLFTKNTPLAVDKVSGIKAADVSAGSKLTWKAVEGADGYRVYRYKKATGKHEKIADVKTNSYVDKQVKDATPYSYKIRAYTKASKNYFSSYTTKKVLTSPQVPGKAAGKRLSKVGKNTTASITFKKAAGSTAYRIYKYDQKTEKYVMTYRVKNHKLYSYDSKTKKYTKLSNVTEKNGVITCTLKNLNLKKERVQKYVVRSAVAKEGYPTGISEASRTIIIK